MAVFTLEDAQGGVEVIAFPETYQRSGRADRERHAWCSSAASSSATTSRCGCWRRRSCRIDSVRERVAREVAIRVTAPADRSVFEALGEIFSRHRGDRRVSFEIELLPPPGADGACASGPTCRSQIRVAAVVRRSIARSRSRSSGRDRCRCDDVTVSMPSETLEFEEPIAVLLKEIEALDGAAAHRCARARDRGAAAAARDGPRATCTRR